MLAACQPKQPCQPNQAGQGGKSRPGLLGVSPVFKYLGRWPRALRRVIENICTCNAHNCHDMLHCLAHNSIYTTNDQLAVEQTSQPSTKHIYTSCDIDESDTVIEIHNQYGFVSKNFEDQLNHIINVYHIDHNFVWVTFCTDWSESSQIITNDSLTYYRSNYKITILNLKKRCVVRQLCDLHCERYPSQAMHWDTIYDMCFGPNGTLYVLSIHGIYEIEF